MQYEKKQTVHRTLHFVHTGKHQPMQLPKQY
ncbi:MAG: hypothetical protein RL662_461 [Bacteroidota bacterium]|jgi:hypothetical protein